MKHLNTPLLMTLLCASALFSCNKKDDDAASDANNNVGGPGGGGGGQYTGLGGMVEQVGSHITTIEEGMVPASMASTALRLIEEGPCAGSDGFVDCQPELLKVYLGMSKDTVSTIKTVVAEIAGGLSSAVTIPTDGVEVCDTIENPDPEGDITEIDYCVTTQSKYRTLLHSSKGPFVHLSVEDSTYALDVNPSNAPEEEGEEEAGPAALHAEMTYTDEDNFQVMTQIVGMPCNANDVRAPESIVVKISKEEGVAFGKAMLYHPRWVFQNGVDCSTQTTNSLGLGFYTDFVGNDEATTASIYFMPVTLSSVDEISSYPLSATCSTFPTMCNNGYGFGDPNPISGYSNPFCIKADATSSGAACDSELEAISEPQYGAASRWIAPSELKALQLDIPESLD